MQHREGVICASLCFIKKTTPYFYLLNFHHKIPKENLSKSWVILTPNPHQKLSRKLMLNFIINWVKTAKDAIYKNSSYNNKCIKKGCFWYSFALGWNFIDCSLLVYFYIKFRRKYYNNKGKTSNLRSTYELLFFDFFLNS